MKNRRKINVGIIQRRVFLPAFLFFFYTSRYSEEVKRKPKRDIFYHHHLDRKNQCYPSSLPLLSPLHKVKKKNVFVENDLCITTCFKPTKKNYYLDCLQCINIFEISKFTKIRFK